ncbi:MAG: threonine dehydratase [Alphaproteobacteria bacterium]|nr:threonine dehydratase [Alphaproteobacteria bacterium]
MIPLARLEDAADLIRAAVPPTPQHAWPLLSQRAGVELWVKHENHTPVGAFKIRGGLVYMADLKKNAPYAKGVICATRGNHGQSVAFAATRHGLEPVVVVPRGNSVEKNAAMQALGATLVEHGQDFQEAFEYAQGEAQRRGYHAMPSFHPLLVAGVGTYALELFRAVSDLDTVYVPVGLGSGICGTISARDALGLKTRIVGVVSESAPCYARSFAERHAVALPPNPTPTIADGLDCRVPNAEALEAIWKGCERIVAVSDAEIRRAMRAYYTDTHNLAEGAGAATLAALLKEGPAKAGRRVAVVLSGGNIDRDKYVAALSEKD